MKTAHRRLLSVASAAVSLLIVPALKATPLLTAAYEAQLETWLGEGDLNFTNVFTKIEGDGQNATAFHLAADDIGPTFVLMSIYGHGATSGTYSFPSQIIGGYDPQSWTNDNSTNYSTDPADHTAFLFNLTSSEIALQTGYYQTFNHYAWGPYFGRGDLATYYNLEAGYSSVDSYRMGVSPDVITFGASGPGFNIAKLEVYTFAPAASPVPDTASPLGLLSFSLLALAAFRRRVE